MELKNYLLEDIKNRLEKLKTKFILYALMLVDIYEPLISYRESEIDNLRKTSEFEQDFLDTMDYLLDKENFEHFLKHSICEIKILTEIVTAKFNNLDIKECEQFLNPNWENFKKLYDFVAFNTCYSMETDIASEFAVIAGICNEFQEISQLLKKSYIN